MSARPWVRGLRLSLGIALLASLAGAATPDVSSLRPRRWLFEVVGGVNNMALADAKSFYSDVLDFYQQSGIPVESQREFPPNLIFGADLLRGSNPNFRWGLGTRYTWTHAYSLYGDYSGTLDIAMEVRLLALQIVLQKAWSGSTWSPFVDLRVGEGLVWLDASETLDFSSSGGPTSVTELIGDGRAPLAELHFGTRRSMGRYLATGSLGYRYCNVSGPFDLDVSGVVLTLGLGFPF